MGQTPRIPFTAGVQDTCVPRCRTIRCHALFFQSSPALFDPSLLRTIYSRYPSVISITLQNRERLGYPLHSTYHHL